MRSVTALLSTLAALAWICPATASEPGTATKEPPLSLTVRREMPYGNEQVSLVFREKHVELVLNSNFVGPRTGKIRLGKFRAERSEYLDQLRELVGFEDRRIRSRTEFKVTHTMPEGSPAPHRPRMIVRSGEVIDGNAQEELKVILSNVQSQVQWTPVDGVEIEKTGDKLQIQPVGKNTAAERVLPFKDVPCDIQPEARDYCQIQGFGGIYLK